LQHDIFQNDEDAETVLDLTGLWKTNSGTNRYLDPYYILVLILKVYVKEVNEYYFELLKKTNPGVEGY
jgi:hypothetical protein